MTGNFKILAKALPTTIAGSNIAGVGDHARHMCQRWCMETFIFGMWIVFNNIENIPILRR